MEKIQNSLKKFKYNDLVVWGSAIAVFAFGARLSKFASAIIIKDFPDRPMADDLLFRLFEYNLLLEYVTDVIAIMVILIAVFYMIRKGRKLVPYYMSLVGIFYSLRAVLNVLTPLQRPMVPDTLHGLARLVSSDIMRPEMYNFGMFPSGHVGLTMLFYLIATKYASKGVSRILALLVIVESVLMVASRGHYSIDIVGALALAYLVFEFGESKLKQKMLLN